MSVARWLLERWKGVNTPKFVTSIFGYLDAST
jgi:hypothetical protein